MNKRVIAIAAAVALAAVGTFILVQYVQGAEDRALEGEETVDVLVVDRLIVAGTPVESLGSSVRAERVPAKVQAAGSVGSLTGLEGSVATVDLLPGEQLVSTRFQPAAVFQELQEEEKEVEVPDGYLEVTIELSPVRALGGAVRPGDTVGVVVSFRPFDIEEILPEEEQAGAETAGSIGVLLSSEDDVSELFGSSTSTTTHLVIHKALVTKVQERLRATGANNVNTGQNDEAQPVREPAPTGDIFVTLALLAGDVEKLVFSAEHGSIWLAREEAHAIEDGTAIQTRATIYQ